MKKLAPLFTDDARLEPYWWDAAPPRQLSMRDVPSNTDYAIIGGGYTGLSAALTIAKAGGKATVFEAEGCGWGASSRNGGMFGPLFLYFANAKRFGVERARAIVEDSIEGTKYIHNLIKEEKIDCDCKTVGHFKGAMTPALYEDLARQLDEVKKYVACDAQLISRSEQKKYIGSDLYHGGIFNPGYAGLHPARYVLGLSNAAERAGAEIITGTRVSGIEQGNGKILIRTEHGVTAAKKLIVATNGYTEGLSKYLQRRIMPIPSGIIATQPLPAEVMARLMPTRSMQAGSQRVVTYYRPSPDGTRILFGGRVLHFGDVTDVASSNARHLHRKMVNVFPELAKVRLTHYWQGNTGYTFDAHPHIGEIDGFYFAVGYCGTGVMRATWHGHKIALRAMGASNSESAYDGLPFLTRPLYNGKPWFLPAVITWYEMRDRWDERGK